MTLCPGKKQRGALSGDWNRDLDEDLGAICKWGASSIVSMIEEAELVELSVANLGERAEALGLDWYHLPVEDGDVPGADFEALWTFAGHRLRRALQGGERILIHCKGGLGRTGTIAARLLVELGEPPRQAIAMVRAARPHTIETRTQELYVSKCGPCRSDEQYADRVLGCLLGGATGDALGYEVEFDSWSEIKRRYGAHGVRDLMLHDQVAPVSDDTQMTLFTLEGILRALRKTGSSVGEEIRRAYADWLATQGEAGSKWKAAGRLCREPSMRYRRAPGNTCLAALQEGESVPESKGCGGVIRVAPIGLVRRWAPSQCFEIGEAAAALTHGHPTGYLSSGAFAAMIRCVLEGAEIAAAAREALAMLESRSDSGETREALNAALQLKSGRKNSLPAVSHLGEGWIAEEALAIGLHAALIGNSFAEVLEIAANHDGDSDSTASIAGQLYGARHGIAALPNRWIRRVDVLVPLLRLASELIEIDSEAVQRL